MTGRQQAHSSRDAGSQPQRVARVCNLFEDLNSSFLDAIRALNKPHSAAQSFDLWENELGARISMLCILLKHANGGAGSASASPAIAACVGKEFSPKQRGNFKRQIAALYRGKKIDRWQKERLDELLSDASKLAGCAAQKAH